MDRQGANKVLPLPQHFLGLSAELLEESGALDFQVRGMSMGPTIFDKEVIRVEPVAPHDVRRGDILLYCQENQFIVHRVMRVEKREGNALFFIVRGDALYECDQPVVPEQVLGKAVSVERRGCIILLDSRKSRLFCTTRRLARRLKKWIIRICHFGKGFLGWTISLRYWPGS